VIPGLQYGNSPLTYNASFIKGKTLALTTTNGTRLLHLAKGADTIVIGSFLNLNALCQYLLEKQKKVLLACAAWKDKVNMEDTLFAGAVAYKLKSHFRIGCDSAQIASRLYQQAEGSIAIFNLLKESSHYQRLAAFGLQKDMEYCTTLNLHPVVPVYNGTELVVLQ
jgi:2-phosphosulfolactate phosphatase